MKKATLIKKVKKEIKELERQKSACSNGKARQNLWNHIVIVKRILWDIKKLE